MAAQLLSQRVAHQHHRQWLYCFEPNIIKACPACQKIADLPFLQALADLYNIPA